MQARGFQRIALIGDDKLFYFRKNKLRVFTAEFEFTFNAMCADNNTEEKDTLRLLLFPE